MLRRGLISVLTVALLVSGGNAVKTALEFQEENEIYEVAEQTFVTIVEEQVPLAYLPTESSYHVPVVGPATECAEETQESEEEVATPEVVVPMADPYVPGITVNFDGLTAVNPDVMTWIKIPNSSISYPVLQGEDNQQYLDTTYDGRHSAVGSIFMDYRNDGTLTDQNTILYGHNVSSGSMFGSLKSYRDTSYGAEHPYFFLLQEEGYLGYEICYVIVTTATSSVYDFEFTEENSFGDHLAMLAEVALYDMGVEVTEQDKIVTLSTCTGVTESERLVVIGKLERDDLEPEEVSHLEIDAKDEPYLELDAEAEEHLELDAETDPYLELDPEEMAQLELGTVEEPYLELEAEVISE